MHRIIKEYIETTKSLLEILLGLPNNGNLVEEALRILVTDDTKIENVQNKIDRAIEFGHPDEEVFLLFISQLIFYFANNKMSLKLESAYRISCSFEISRYHPELQSFYFQACSYYHVTNKNFDKADELIMKSIRILSIDSKRYIEALIGAGQLFSIDGRLALMPKAEFTVLSNQKNINYQCLRILLRNALFTAEMNSIEKYETEWRLAYTNQHMGSKEKIDIAIEILKGNFNERPLQPAELNHYLLYYRSLKEHKLSDAKMYFKKIDFAIFYSKYSKIFYFINYHHAFVTEWYEIIESLISNSDQQGYHYMLDFFIARYFLIKNKKDLASMHYLRLIKNCEKFQAFGRLKFELQFAYELNATSFFELTQLTILNKTLNKKLFLPVELISQKENVLDIKRIIGKSNAIVDIKKKALQFADIDRPLLILGETGTGKEEIARAIHESSKLKDKPFLAINCGTLTDTLLQSELFGHEIGAFTGAVSMRKGIFDEAGDGIVFLDEFGEMSPKLQISLLRVIENKEIRRIGGAKTKKINCRIIAATNANIEDLITKKLFREDLYHRLKQFSIFMPPLRERKEDIPVLISFFLNQQGNSQTQVFSNELITKFINYQWPGNIRELKNIIDRIKIFCGNKPIIEKADVDIEWLNNDIQFNARNANSQITHSDKNNISIEEKMQQLINQKKISPADRRNQKIKLLFVKFKQLTRSQIAEALEISPLTAAQDLKRLCDENFIVKKMPNNCPRSFYFEIIT